MKKSSEELNFSAQHLKTLEIFEKQSLSSTASTTQRWGRWNEEKMKKWENWAESDGHKWKWCLWCWYSCKEIEKNMWGEEFEFKVKSLLHCVDLEMFFYVFFLLNFRVFNKFEDYEVINFINPYLSQF